MSTKKAPADADARGMCTVFTGGETGSSEERLTAMEAENGLVAKAYSTDFPIDGNGIMGERRSAREGTIVESAPKSVVKNKHGSNRHHRQHSGHFPIADGAGLSPGSEAVSVPVYLPGNVQRGF